MKVPATNLEWFQRLSGDLFRQAIAGAELERGDSVILSVDSPAPMPYVRMGMSEAASADSFRVFDPAAGSIRYQLDVLPIESTVQYPELLQEGMFGRKSVVRDIRLACSFRLIDLWSHEVSYSASLSKEVTDTVALDEVEHIQTPAIPSTQAVLPPDRGFDRYVEPFVIIGAAGIAVYLLFHVRS